MADLGFLTQEYLRQAVDYDPLTGLFVWRERPREHFAGDGPWKTWNSKHSGTPAFSFRTPDGYVRGKINAVAMRAHRLAWFWTYGEWPAMVDHINGIRWDNRLANLRPVTDAESMRNLPLRSDNKVGLPGITFDPKKRLWRVRFAGRGGRRFKHLDDALRYRRENEAKFGFHANHGRAPT